MIPRNAPQGAYRASQFPCFYYTNTQGCIMNL